MADTPLAPATNGRQQAKNTSWNEKQADWPQSPGEREGRA